MSDEQLVVDALAGSHAAFDQLVRRHQGRLYGYLRQRLPDDRDAEDITQETFLRCWQRLHQYRPKYRFTTWLFTIGHRLAINHLRRDRRTNTVRRDTAVMAQTLVDHAAATDARAIAAELHTGIWATAAGVLTSGEMQAMWLRYAENLTAGEIAHVTGRSTVGVRVMLHRARLRLETHLREHVHHHKGVEPRADAGPPVQPRPVPCPDDDSMARALAHPMIEATP